MAPFDLRAAIVRHPWAALAIAFATGAAIALGERSPRPLVRATSLAVGGLLVSAFRDAATRGLAERARSWVDERDRIYA